MRLALSKLMIDPPFTHLPPTQVGWKHGEAVAELEEKRKAKAAKFYEAKKKALALRAKAVAQTSA